MLPTTVQSDEINNEAMDTDPSIEDVGTVSVVTLANSVPWEPHWIVSNSIVRRSAHRDRRVLYSRVELCIVIVSYTGRTCSLILSRNTLRRRSPYD